ncbi:MAG: hypothetical protein HYX41_03265 [Bdellovibrio sp.]|nr:hypothetical protein [Bdellovibrio sp.]
MKWNHGLKRSLVLFLIFELAIEAVFPASLLYPFASARADDLTTGLSVSKDLGSMKAGQGSEFISGDYPGAVLMRVNLWGAVGKPGIHFVPTQTDLITLMSYAGGPTESAKLGGVYIKRWSRGKEIVLDVDAEDLLEGTGTKPPILQANDVVVIPQKKPIISQDMGVLVSFVASVLSIVAVGIVLTRK